jgi:hypothetical protein
MRVSRFLSIIGFITLACLGYVWQQTEIVRLAYASQKNVTALQDLVDHNNILRYNIQTNASLVRLGNKIAKMENFQIPDTYRLVRLTPPAEGLKTSKQEFREGNIFSRMFGINRQAEARTTGP